MPQIKPKKKKKRKKNAALVRDGRFFRAVPGSVFVIVSHVSDDDAAQAGDQAGQSVQVVHATRVVELEALQQRLQQQTGHEVQA